MKAYTCAHAAAGCNYPESDCINACVLSALNRHKNKEVEVKMETKTQPAEPVDQVGEYKESFHGWYEKYQKMDGKTPCWALWNAWQAALTHRDSQRMLVSCPQCKLVFNGKSNRLNSEPAQPQPVYPSSWEYSAREWLDKTEWVQQREDWPFPALGMHRADVMKKYIEHLEAQAQPAEPVGYWQGEFSKDGGAILYEVPQVSAFGRSYPNIPLWTHPPAEVVRLTDDEWEEIGQRYGVTGMAAAQLVRFALAAAKEAGLS